MNMEFQDPELFADFIIEAKEHLETIEPTLLELEKTPDNLSLLNDIFRPVHSLKGSSGFLGLTKMNQLAHRGENVLDELRKGTIQVTSEMMDIILAVTDGLEQMIESLRVTNTEGDVDYSDLIATLDGIIAGEDPATIEHTEAPAPVAETPVETPAPVEEVSVPVAEAPVETPAPAPAEAPVETPAPAPAEAFAPVTEAAPVSSGSGKGKRSGDTMPTEEWIQTLEQMPPSPLVAFGEAHLKDFAEETFENIENITTHLITLEETPEVKDEVVNDLFRYFHNVKGNSGIIDYNELNTLTHEAETLLNKVRHGEQEVTPELIDLLLLVADVMEFLVKGIDPAQGIVIAHNTQELVLQLQKGIAGEGFFLPPSIFISGGNGEAGEAVAESPAPAETVAPVAPVAESAPAPAAATAPSSGGGGFADVLAKEKALIEEAIKALEADASQDNKAEAVFNALTNIEKAAGSQKLAGVEEYAQRTAGLVGQARKSGMDFSLMLDILKQEVAITYELAEKEIGSAPAPAAPAPATPAPATPAPAPAAPTPAPAAPAPTPAPAAPAPTPPPAPAPAPAPAPKPVAPTSSAKPTMEECPKCGYPNEDKMASKVATPAATAAPKPATPAATAKAATPPPAPKPAPKPAPATSAAPPPKPTSKLAAKRNEAKAAASEAKGSAESKAASTIRVDHEKLDHLMNLIGELIINRNRYTMLARQLEGKPEDIDLSEIAQNLSETTYSMARISDELQDTIMKVRMVPVSSVFSRFPRLVRDLSRKSNKEVDLILEGEETELDKSVVEVIGDPLVHLIRNSVDHGVENEADRIAAGKDPKGKVILRAYHKGNSVAIDIQDDGKGIDPEKMRETAVRKGVITAEEAKNLDDKEAVELIFAPGFSSAAEITDISGRGVGMDVVRTNIKSLKGSVTTTTEIGKGTTFTLALPLTLAIIDALMVNVSGQTYAIPLDAVSETTKIEASRLTDIKGKKAVTLRGEVLGIVEMPSLLNVVPSYDELPEMLSIVVIHENNKRLGIVVDRLLERQEIVIKPLGAYLNDLPGISGATIMGDGSVILILDPHEIYNMATTYGNPKA